MTINLVQPARPEIHRIQDIYDPGNPSGPGIIVPRVSALINDNGLGRWVESVDPVTYEVTYAPFISMIVTDGEDLVSTVSYGNDVFRVFYDNRPNPKALTPSARLVIYGNDVATYRVIRYPGTNHAVAISRYYDADGVYVGASVPMTRVADGHNAWFCNPCYTTVSLSPGEQLNVEFYNDAGTMVAFATCTAKESAIINEAPNTFPVIMGATIRSSQERAPGEIYMMEKQDIASLNLSVWVTYDDGREVQYPIDNQKTFLYGTEDLIASYSGMQQQLSAKVMLGPGDMADPNVVVNGTHVVADATVTVIANELAAPIKISVLPRWNTATSRYVLHYTYYTCDRNTRTDITSLVSIASGTFVGNLYGASQSFVIQVDMSLVDPVTYTESVTYQQNVVILLQPYVAYQRYTLRTSLSSTKIYGVDSPTSRRPVIYYDEDIEQYFIPSSVFLTQEAFLRSFYENAEPPYNTVDEEAPLVPTHFIMRDLASGAMVVAGQIDLGDYNVAWSITGSGAANRYVGNSVIIEFIRQVDVSTNLVLFGVPVDVYTGTYNG